MTGNNAMFFHLEPGEYVCFVDQSTVDVQNMVNIPLPEGVTIHIIPVACKPGQSISQAVLVQKMDKMDEFLIQQHGNPWEEIN